MSTKVRTISVNLTAGTAKFFADLDAGKGKIREFGREGVSGMVATSGAMKELHGNFLNNTRAADRFLESVLGLGPAMQKIFPVVGALAFAGIIVEVGTKVYEFFKNMQEAGEKSALAFRGLEAPLRLTNDELAISKQRLENEIALLEGKHANTLALALLEAKKAADDLANSLDNDLTKLHDVLEKETVSYFAIRTAGTRDLAPMVRRFQTEQAELADKTPAKELPGAQLELLKKQIAEVDADIAAAHTLADKANEERKRVAAGGLPASGVDFSDQSERLRQLGMLRRQLEAEATRNTLTQAVTSDSAKKTVLEAAKPAPEPPDPYGKKLDELRAKLKGVNEELAAIGQSHSAQVLTKAFADANVELARVNDALKQAKQPALTEDQAKAMRKAFADIATGEDQAAWGQKIDAATKKLQDETTAQNTLTAAIVKGHDAVRAAHAQAEVMKAMGPERYDPQSAEAEKLRAGALALYDAQHAAKAAEAVRGLNEQIAMEKALAAAQNEGAEAVRQAAIAIKLRQMVAEHATQEQIDAVIELANAERENVNSASIARINERIAATERLTAAIGKGTEAVRAATLANELAEIAREGDTPVPGMPSMGQRALAAAGLESAEHRQQVAQTAVNADRLQSINDQAARLTEAKQTLGETLAIEIELRNLENERLQELVGESLALGSARDGVRAFFIEMQENAMQASDIIYNALNSVLDRASSNLAKLTTGQKTDWAKSFQQVGGSMVESSVKSMAKEGLGKLGQLFGVETGTSKPDGTSANPLWVRLAGALAGSGAGTLAGIPSGSSEGMKSNSGIGGFLMKLLGIGGGGAAEGGADGKSIGTLDMTPDFGGFMAGGGDVEPGKLYMTGEEGPEPFIPKTPGTIIPHGALGSSVSITNNIDARGADLGAHNRIARAIEMSHEASVSTALRAMHEHTLRVPEK